MTSSWKKSILILLKLQHFSPINYIFCDQNRRYSFSSHQSLLSSTKKQKQLRSWHYNFIFGKIRLVRFWILHTKFVIFWNEFWLFFLTKLWICYDLIMEKYRICDLSFRQINLRSCKMSNFFSWDNTTSLHFFWTKYSYYDFCVGKIRRFCFFHPAVGNLNLLVVLYAHVTCV